MIKQMNWTKRYGPRAKETALRIIVLGNGRGMLSWLAIKEEPCNSFNCGRRQPSMEEMTSSVVSEQMEGIPMGGGMLIWPRGQGPFSKQTVVERKEIISSVGDGTEE
jgi:hypothetical protein